MQDDLELIGNNSFIYDIVVYVNSKDNTLLISDTVISEIEPEFLKTINVSDYVEIFNFTTNDLEQANNMASMISTLYTAGANNKSSDGDGLIKITPFVAMKYYHNRGTSAHKKIVAGLYKGMEKMFGIN